MDTQLEDKLEMAQRVIKAAEDWSPEYEKDPDSHESLIKVEAKLEREMRKYFTELADRVDRYVNWYEYGVRLREIQAADNFKVDVIITDDALDAENELVMKVVFNEVSTATNLGMNAGESIYRVPLGPSESYQSVQKTARESIAELVGKRVDRDGNIVDNPKAKYRISDTTRNDIRESIRTSLSLGEDQSAATARLRQFIRNPKRAQRIAQTETVNAYQRGLVEYGRKTGAVGKEWQALPGACRYCLKNAAAGPIGLKDRFPTGHSSPSCHPGDRCGIRLIYPEDPTAKDIRNAADNSPVNLDTTDLATIAQEDIAGRPNAEINTMIEKLLASNKPSAVRDSIKLAKQLKADDQIAMLNSISYNGKSVIDGYYQVKFDVATGKITHVLVSPSKNPLNMTADQIADAAGIPKN